MAMVLELKAVTGSQMNRKLSVENRVTRIGSASSNDLVLQERQIEPRHAEIHQILDRFFLVPLVQRGLSLNGLPVTGRSRINQGDVLTLGATSYRISIIELQEQAYGAPAAQHNVPRLGDYFLRRGLMDAEQVDRTFKRQKELQRDGRRIAFGQVAYDLGYINRSQLETALNEQRSDFNERFHD